MGLNYTPGVRLNQIFESKKKERNIVIVNNLLHNHEKHLEKCTERLACKSSNQKRKIHYCPIFPFFFRMDSTPNISHCYFSSLSPFM